MESYLAWDAWVHTVRGSVHFLAALTALILGPYILLRPKGTAAHRLWGRIWFGCMLFVNISALIMYELAARPNLFHIFAVLSLVTVIPGFLSIRKYRKTREKRHLITHQYCMIWGYFGLASAGVWQVGFRVMLDLKLVSTVGLLYTIFGVFTFATAMALSRYMARRFPAAG